METKRRSAILTSQIKQGLFYRIVGIMRKAPELNHDKRSASMSSFAKAYELFGLIIEDDGEFDVAVLSRVLGLPQSTVYRHLKTLTSNGMLVRTSKGKLNPGPSLLKKLSSFDANEILAEVSLPHLQDLRSALGVVVHFGVLEDDMVTYLVKIGNQDTSLFTREGEQLEAYCSGIGKVLLAHMSSVEQQTYLSSGPFPRLTSTTITDPDQLATELRKIRIQAFAVDRGEIRSDIFCLAVPVFAGRSEVIGAISISQLSETLITEHQAHFLTALRETAARISIALNGSRS